MPDTKITALTAIGANPIIPATFPIPMVDLTDTSMAASGTTKKVTVNQILGAGGTATLASATITGDLTVDTSTLKVDSANNRVGIGTASPVATLQSAGTLTISGGTNASSANGLHQYFDTATNTAYIISFHSGVDNRDLVYDAKSHGWRLAAGTAMTLNSTGLGVGGSPAAKLSVVGGNIRLDNNQGLEWGGANNYIYGSEATDFIALVTNGVEALRINNSQNVGIGVTPSAWSTYKAIQVGQIGAFWANPSGTDVYLSANQYFGSGSDRYIANGLATIYKQNAGVHSWLTAPSGTAGNAITFTQAMTLDAVSSLHVNTTSYVNIGVGVVNSKNAFNIVPDNTGNAGNRNWNFSANASAAGNLDIVVSSANNTYPNSAYRMQLTSAGAAYNTTGTWGTISDSRLKENISDARNYLADLLKLRVVKYSLKEEASAVATKLGLIAQEVEQVFPSLVEQSDVTYDGGDGIRTVKTSILVPMLLKAIQELTARVQTLEAK